MTENEVKMKMDFPLAGVIPPLVTPLLDADTLDHGGLEKLISHVLAGGVHGIFLLGTTGEGPGLSGRIKYELVGEAVKIISRRVPVLVGISDSSFIESLKLAEHAAGSGADAVVLAPPYYLPASRNCWNISVTWRPGFPCRCSCIICRA